MTDDDIARIARIRHISEEVVRRIVNDKAAIKQVMQKYPGCTEMGAIFFLIEKEKSAIE